MNTTTNKREIKLVALAIEKAKAQHLTCFTAFIASAALSIILMLVACVMPAMANVTEVTCWSAMILEAMSIGLGYASYWIYKNALK